VHDLREALKGTYQINKVGGSKYEVYTQYGVDKGKSRKLIMIEYPEEIFIITGAEGSE